MAQKRRRLTLYLAQWLVYIAALLCGINDFTVGRRVGEIGIIFGKNFFASRIICHRIIGIFCRGTSTTPKVATIGSTTSVLKVLILHLLLPPNIFRGVLLRLLRDGSISCCSIVKRLRFIWSDAHYYSFCIFVVTLIVLVASDSCASSHSIMVACMPSHTTCHISSLDMMMMAYAVVVIVIHVTATFLLSNRHVCVVRIALQEQLITIVSRGLLLTILLILPLSLLVIVIIIAL